MISFMNNSRSKSIALNSAQPRVYRTFEDWQAEQLRDKRTPEERGIHIGSSVMWRHRDNGIIVTDRATVIAISGNTITLRVKDVQERTCQADVAEIVVNDDDKAGSTRR
ncbi:MAG: hypothetical protein KatS3mg053_3626 [Candidatus Roseilinea sp.]|nr:MAG: hypothetical protein KatS3mg053_3626 [Candidatus Roseilinea sp.]